LAPDVEEVFPTAVATPDSGALGGGGGGGGEGGIDEE